MLNKIKEKIDYRLIPMVLSWVFFFQKFWPLLSISRYNHSNADDYWMSSDVHHVWDATHSIFSVIGQAWKNAVYLWQYWDGCFISMFIGCMPPVVIDEALYKYTFVVIAGMMILGMISFLFVLLIRVMKMDWIHFGIICPLMLTIFIAMCPTIKEGYYWWVGGINYSFMFGLFLLAQAFVLEYMVSKKISILVIASLLSFCIGIGNLLSGLINPCILILELIAFLFLYKKKGLLFLIPTVCGIAGLMCNVLAPGNLIRGGDLFSSSVIGAITGTIVASTNFLQYFYKPSMLCIVLCIFLTVFDAFSKKPETMKFSYSYPLGFLVLSYLVYCATFTPVIYAGSAYVGRCQNISFFMLILMVLANVIYFAGWLHYKLPALQNARYTFTKGILVCISMVLVLIFGKVCSNSYHTQQAEYALEIGQAQDFHNKVMARYAVYYNNSVKDCVFGTIDWIPTVFYWDDDCLTDLEYYFYKDSIKVIE